MLLSMIEDADAKVEELVELDRKTLQQKCSRIKIIKRKTQWIRYLQ